MEIYELLAKRIMNEAIPEDYVEWAEGLLRKGEDRESVKILAALTLTKPVYWFDVEKYFKNVLTDLNIDDSDDSVVLREYSRIIAQKIIDNEIIPVTGVQKLAEVFVASGYQEKYSNWDILEDQVSFLFDAGPEYTNIPITEKNLDNYIKEETKLFLHLLDMHLPKCFSSMSFCEKCSSFDTPRIKKEQLKWYHRLLRKKPRYQSICVKCGCSDLISMSSHEGMKLYLENLSNDYQSRHKEEKVKNINEAIEKLRKLNRSVPIPMCLPTEEEIVKMEKKLEVRFHPDYREYLLKASDVVYPTLEPATITNPKSHTYLPKVYQRARDWGVPQDLLPICEDNANFYCMNKEGQVLYWAHDGWTDEKWDNLATWIQDVWIDGN